jgi:alkaline phosphatase D
MAPSPVLAACMAAVALSAIATDALRTGNLNYLAPVHELPQLAKFEPADVLEAHGRSLLAGNPAKAAWAPKTNRQSDQIFVQGVASGDPFAKSVILWTRVTPPSGAKNKPATLDWAVATDKAFKKIASRGTTITSKDVDFTVKVEAKKLKPNTKYFYQFRYRQNDKATPVYSVIGRTRTLPRADEDIARTRIAFFGCSNLPTGFFTSYGQIAQAAERGEIDYNIHTGDYIYEYKTDGNSLFSPEDKIARTHQPEKEILTIQDYRTRHNQYNSDKDTKWMRRSAPLIPVWDDHEYTNDAWKGGAQNHQPETEGDWNERRLRALQVYYEMMPIRQANADNKQQIYRNFEIGKLIKLIMLDTRIIGRDLQNGTAREDPTRTILGSTQKEYLKQQLTAAKSAQTWKVIGQQVLFAHRCDSPSADQWDGYRQDQRDVLDHLANNKIDNTIVLTGDIHTHWANDVPKYPCPREGNYSYTPETGKGSLAVEFVSSSITSGYNPSDANKASAVTRAQTIKAANPHVKYQDSFYKGYAIIDVRRKETTATWYFAPDLLKAGQYETKVQGESWKVVAGTNHLVKA